MYWLFDEKLQEIYSFYQIFFPEIIKADGNTIYNLESDSGDNIKFSDKNVLNIIKTKSIKPIKINYQIKIMGNLISYTNIDSGKNITFIKKDRFYEHNDTSKVKRLIFNFEYKLTDNHRLPELTSKSYDYFYENISFGVYRIDDNSIYVEETNNKNNSNRNFLLQKNLS